MQNKTLILVLTGLGIVAAAIVAGLTRDQWLGHKPEVVATAPASTEAPKTPDQAPATTAGAAKPASATTDQPAAPAPATAEQPAATAPATAEQPATTAPATAEQPATTAPVTTEQPAAPAPATTEQPAATAPAAATEPPKDTGASQQTAMAQPESPPATPVVQPPGNAAASAKVPAFDTVRVEKTGEAVIAGTATPGADVVVKLDGKVIGETTANSDGAFVLVPMAPLPAGSGALTLESKAPGATEATASQQSVAVIVPAADQSKGALVAVVSPDQPTRVLQKPEVKQDGPAPVPEAEKPAKLVSIDAVDYDSAGNIVFSGQGNEGNTARLYIDNNFIGDAPVGADGRWTFSAKAEVKPGPHTLRVDGLDSAGTVLNRIEVPFVREEPNKVVDASQQPAATQGAQPDGSAKSDIETTQQASQQPAAQPPESQPPESQPPESQPPESQQPESQQQPAATPARPKDGRVVIQPGNNLWTIARVLYGSGAKFTTLYEANKNQIRDPNRIYPGQIFKTPNVAPTSESIDPRRREPLRPEENAATGQ
ncbi:LysM peptidoglycan-binding domain-containing protein [Aestuariivirga sp.]|uniref:LysM peptidoglycan-binding domain-containing protein n=1 Tax=Aestuariivirga sp. TaxID=2650926 RepID=UPI0025C69CCC|nr:LysM peptidoglycan-binding domain-containing protein [Aestuariivirga sp.]MCA3555445.1 LysM peptidoglycan-binding domain-containing protein [Aestuariivirga sp.]